MIQIDLRTLVGKLNDTTRNALESAAGLCLSRTHYDIEVEHWLIKLLEATDTELTAILHHFGVDLSKLAADLTRSLDGFKTGNARPPALSPRIVDLSREAWLRGEIPVAICVQTQPRTAGKIHRHQDLILEEVLTILRLKLMK